MANTFLAAQGHKMGKSLVEDDKIALAKELLAKAKARKVKLLLPVDLVMAETFAADASHKVEKVAKLIKIYGFGYWPCDQHFVSGCAAGC